MNICEKKQFLFRPKRSFMKGKIKNEFNEDEEILTFQSGVKIIA